MASKTKAVTLNFLLISAVIILGRNLRISINNKTKYSLGYPKDSLLNFTELTGKYGYTTEEHTVTTEDGYLLKLFRITKGKNCHGKIRKPPVILMHGLLQSADAFIDAGPNSGLAYIISDACYDLWVGNQRGNYYSRRHVRLNPDEDSQFWKFSVDEIGYYDIPATIDYVLKYTGSEKVNYIGYSQGACAYFIMCSERPGYCEKSDILITLAPAAKQKNTKSKIYRLVARGMQFIRSILNMSGVHEVFSKGDIGQEFLAFFCQLGMISKEICGTGIALFDSYHPGSITNETIQVMFGHFPAGTSVQNMARYGQSMASDIFEKFDYGKSKNLEVYGSAHPPKYNLKAVTVPVVVLYGNNDRLVDPEDVKWLANNLPNVIDLTAVKDPLWNHFDVSYSRYSNELLFPKINHYLLKYSYS